ncbi:MAG: hypothetical protein SGCHY_004020 [Lobulomycetales sp.]
MLEARLAEGSVFKKVMDAIKDLINEVNFDCNETGISLQSMDTAHVALVVLLIKAESFDPYRCDRSMSLGLSLGSLSKILKCAGPKDTLTLKSADQNDTLQLVFEGGADGERTSEFDLKLMDIDGEHLGIPESDYDVCVTMSSAEYSRICRDLSVLGDSVTIECNKNQVKFMGGGDIGTGSITIKHGAVVDADKDGNGPETSIQVNTPVYATFALKYLANFAKAGSLCDTVILSISNTLPLVVEYKVNDLGYIRYYLAPRVEDDDE